MSTRREFLKTIVAGATALGIENIVSAQAEENKGANRPNVVLIISDDQGFTDYGFMGHDTIRTPRLDQLASESVVFTRGYVPTALCSPSLGTLLTGLYPHQHGIIGNDPVPDGPREQTFEPFLEKFERCPRLPEMLARAGYVSFQTGKLWMGHYARAGFTGGMTTKGRHGDDGLKIGRETMQPAFDFIDKSQMDGKPFFLWYAPFLPHTPHNPPERLLEKYKDKTDSEGLAKYYAMCGWLDETCGQLLDHLDQRNLRENTIVLYICDNGWLQGRDELSPGGAKMMPYEMGVRTPIMIRWSGQIEPRIDREHLASSLDIVPTILATCGLKPTQDMPGIDLLDNAAVEARDVLFGENFTHDMIDVNRPVASLRVRTVIQGNWKLIVWQNPQPSHPRMRSWEPKKPQTDAELYDLEKDPFEKINLMGKHPDKVASLMKLLDGWWTPK